MNRPSGSKPVNDLNAALHAYQLGDLPSASRRVDQLLANQPRSAGAQRLKGMIVMAGGDHAGAVPWILSSLREEPTNADSLTLAAYLHLALNRFGDAEAISRSLLQVHANDARAHSLLASALFAQEMLQEALLEADRSLALNPNHVDVLVLRARILTKSRKSSEAVATYRSALAIQPSVPATVDLAGILLKDSQPEKALELLLALPPKVPTANQPHSLIAQTYTQMRRFEEAGKHWSLAEKYSRNRAEVVHARADSETAVGRFDVAEDILRRAIDDDVEVAESFFLLTRARKMNFDDTSLLRKLESLLAKGELQETQKSRLNFALGKSFDDLGDFERAIRHYDEANRIDYSIYPMRRSFQAEESSTFTDLQIQFFSAERVRTLAAAGLSSALPLFVVGMVRSGTTLTENILSAHSQIKPLGEQMFWTQRAVEFLKRGPDGLQIDFEIVKRFGEEYLAMLDPGQPDIRYVTDKNPTNIHMAALLHCVFPNAKMVHLKRHPVDNLLSMWMTPFDAGVRCASNRENLVSFYRDYLRLSQRWAEVIPADRFAPLRYEDLTSEPEHAIPGLLEHLGLDSEQACYEPEKNKRSVLTPSVYQVRQPIHRGSQARWKNYRQWLGPFAELLDLVESASV